jgi:sialate O-acetylesterase
MQTLGMKKNVGMVVVSDLVDNVADIHPKNKHDVGYRLADLALTKTYKLSGFEYEYPIYQSYKTVKNKITVYFDNKIKMQGKKADELFIAGDDKIYFPADCKISDNSITVWNDKVKNPVSVRYSFSKGGIGNLFGINNLPVSPFRTDTWDN